MSTTVTATTVAALVTALVPLVLSACGNRGGGAQEAAASKPPIATSSPANPAASVALAADERVLAAESGHPWFRLQEHPELPNDCSSDADCKVDGCAAYACTAKDALVLDVCRDAPALAPIGASCGCVRSACQWWRAKGYAGVGTEGQPCEAGGTCIGALSHRECPGHLPAQVAAFQRGGSSVRLTPATTETTASTSPRCGTAPNGVSAMLRAVWRPAKGGEEGAVTSASAWSGRMRAVSGTHSKLE